jgi:hypothetical protein
VVVPAARWRRDAKVWILFAAVSVALLGQGERCEVDPHFSTPGATLTTYWEALRSDDGATVSACFTDPRQAMPCPGMLWFLPPCETVSLAGIRYSAGEEGTVIATYELRFRPIGMEQEMRVLTSSTLERVHGEWRIRPAAGTTMPEWRPIPHRVDI